MEKTASQSVDVQPNKDKEDAIDAPTPAEEEVSEPTEKPAEEEPAEQGLKGIQLTMVIAGITLVTLLILLDVSIVSTAVPQITNEFQSLQDVAWYGSAYTIASAALQTLTGKMYTYFKTKWIFLGCFFVFELGSLICGLANSSAMLIVGRAVAGIGASGLMNGGLNIVAGAVPIDRRPIYLGIMMGIAQLGLVTGPIVGGALTTKVTWRWCFYINLPIGGLITPLLLFSRIPDQTPKGPMLKVLRSLSLVNDLDIIGLFFFASASVELLLALQFGGNKYAWNSATIIGLFCGSGVTYVILILWERRMGPKAMIPSHIMSRRIIWSSCITMLTIFGSTMNLSFYLPVFFQSVQDKTALTSGIDLLPSVLCQVVMAVSTGVLTSKTGYYLPWGILGSAFNVIGMGLFSTLSPGTTVPEWAGFQAIIGLGRGASVQVPMVAIQNAVSPADMSAAMAILTCSQTFGGAIFLSLGQVVLTEGLRANLRQYAPSVDPDAIIAVGATNFRSIVSPADLPNVLVAYSKSIGWVFYLNVGVTLIQFIASWGMGWVNLKKKKAPAEDSIEAKA